MDKTLLGGSVTVRVHPVVLLQICDAYVRRKEEQERVIGSLLGVLDKEKGQIEIRSCYVVPHNESADQVGRAGVTRRLWWRGAGLA